MTSQKGASLMIALLFFLVCAIVGSVVLTAATVTSKRNSSANTDANRRRYAIMSAEDVITNQLKGTSDDEGSSESFEKSWSFHVTAIPDGDGYTINSSDTYVPASYTSTTNSSGTQDTTGSNSTGTTDTVFASLRKEMAEKIISHYWPYFTAGTSISSSSSTGDTTPDNDTTSADPSADPWEDEYPLTDWNQIIIGANNITENDEDKALTEAKTKYLVQTSDQTGQKGPLTIKLTGSDDFPTVYADIKMDSAFNLTIHLYCTSGSSSKVKDLVKPDLYIVYNASDVDISYDSDLNDPVAADTTVNRSIQINVSWDQPIITTDSSKAQ